MKISRQNLVSYCYHIRPVWKWRRKNKRCDVAFFIFTLFHFFFFQKKSIQAAKLQKTLILAYEVSIFLR